MAKICDDLSRDGVVLEAATGAVASWFSTFLMCQLCAIEWKCSEHSTQSINKLFWFFQQLCKYPIVNPFKWVKVVSAICNITLHSTLCAVLCLVAQWCLTLCDPMDYSQSGSSVHRDSPGQNTGVGCYILFQGIFPTQASNPPTLQADSLPSEPPGKPYILKYYSYINSFHIHYVLGIV